MHLGNDWILSPIGVAVGVINAVAGGGSLLSFPALLALGYPPLIANVTNSVGVFTSNIGGIWVYRSALWQLRKTALLMCSAAMVGALGGATLLLRSDNETFESMIPWMIAAGSLLLLLQPTIAAKISPTRGHRHAVLGLLGCIGLAVYGGYFGAAMGVMFMAVFGSLLDQSMQQTNALKNGVAVAVNLVCLILFTLFGDVAWSAAAFLSAGTLVGGLIGSRVARQLPDRLFRLTTVAIGLIAAVLVAAR